MNTIWSDFVQNTGTLYASRMLRFSDAYMAAYRKMFDIDGRKRFLEIGCGPGALAQALARWYPGAEVIGIDRDAAFVQYAAQQAPHIQFLEADAAALPFEDGTFDVTISNTVQEHMEPSAFFGEQYRVLKEGGVCLVLSLKRIAFLREAAAKKLYGRESRITSKNSDGSTVWGSTPCVKASCRLLWSGMALSRFRRTIWRLA